MVPQLLSLLLTILPATALAQSNQRLIPSTPLENPYLDPDLPAFGSYKSLDFNAEFSQSRFFYAGLPFSDQLQPDDGPAPTGAFSTGPPIAADLTHDDVPSAPVRIDLTPLLAHAGQAIGTPHVVSSPDGVEHYHWKGLLLQSFWFFGIEQTARLLTDSYYRYLTVDKPFWHDYIASLHQWNMGRWSDGDDFLVAYIGHPIQGAVTSFIEIQNDPHDRSLRISATRAYWMSRFKGMLWATVFSTDEKVGPLGETALGSEGGYTYIPGCNYGTCAYIPGVTKYTNNTGWVKFITTPVVGTVWVIGEDLIDRYISDPIQEGRPEAVFPKIFRGSINPCRSAANAMRLKKPWYRDFQHPDVVNTSAVHFIRDDDVVIRRLPRLEIFPHWNALSLPVNTSQCGTCRSFTTGVGVGFSYRIKRWLDFDSDLNHQPDASPLPSDRAGGSIISGTFGFRTGIQTPRYALKVALRPGFVSYDRAYLTSPTGIHLLSISGPVIIPPASPTPEIGRITHFVTALSINADYGLTRHFAVRATFGNTPVRYKTDYYDRPPGRGSPPYIYFISPDMYATNENWNYQAGPVLRF